MSKAKVNIDYLQFLNQPELDEESRKWFFTYLEPKTENIKRVEGQYKIKLFNEYKKVKQQLIKLQKSRPIVIETASIIDESKKKEKKYKSTTSLSNNKLISRQIDTKALELKILGHSRQQIIAELVKTYNISAFEADAAVMSTYYELAKEVDEDFIRLTVFSHSQYYDILYKKLIDLSAPKIAMRALKVKETLNGLGQDIFEIQVNNVYEDQKDLINYGMSKLTGNEQKEFIEILNRISFINDNKQKKLNAA